MSSSCRPDVGYLNGRYLPRGEIVISPDDRGFLFADGVYEVVRSYCGGLFRAGAHARRLDRSLREMRIARPDGLDLEQICNELVRRNGLADRDATVYLQVTRGSSDRMHCFPDPATPPTVYAMACPCGGDGDRPMREGVGVILISDQRWSRCDIKTTALAANVMAGQLARERGAAEAVFVRDGVLLEGSRTSIFAVVDDTVLAPPTSNYILPGITREAVMELCADLGLAFRETMLFESKISRFDEFMIVGTTTEITPVVRIGDQAVGSGEVGPATRLLQQGFRRLVEEG